MSGRSWLRSLCAIRTCSQRNCRRSITFRPWLESLEERSTPASLNLTTIADDTLYEVSTADPSLQLSNGAGQHFYVGRTSEGTNDIRRGAIKFDLSAVPAGSTITSVTLTLNLSKTRSGAENIALHRALAGWGEGASNAGQPSMGGGGEGAGTAAKPGDATWFYTVFSTQKWSTPGGDFVSTPSASTSVAGVGSYQWSGTGLVADLQQWANNPSTNFGWIITGNEGSGGTSKQFDTKEDATASARPVLTVVYNPPAPPDLTISKSHIGNFRQGDAADTYTISVSNVGSGATAGTVTVTDPLPAGLSPTAADNGSQNGWTLTTSGQTITASRSDALAAGGNYPALTLTVSVATDAPASLTNTATVAGGGEVNTANDSASDPTTITQGADLAISKSHTGTFRVGDPADTYTITVSNVGSGPTTGTVTVSDPLPTGLAPTAADSGSENGWTVTTTGQTITATRSDVLAPGGSFPALTVIVSVAADAPASVTNTATVAGGGEANTANDSASDPTTITQVADLTLSKTHAGTFRPGDTADTYTILVHNIGPAPTDGSPVTVTDPLPAGLTATAADSGTNNGWTLTVSGQTVTAVRSDVLNGGASYPALTITVSVANDVAPVVTNAATVAGGGEVNTANDSASDPTATTPVADLTINKSHTGNFHQGDVADVYVLTVSNIGPGPTTAAVTITDALPTGLAPTAADNGVLDGWTITTNGQTIMATRTDVLAPGGSYPAFTLTVRVAADAPASLTNTATVAGGGEVDTANDSASDPTTISQAADLTISKSHSGNFHPGDRADTYTITVRNIGPVPSNGSMVLVTDALPTGLVPTGADKGIINGWTVTTDGQTITAMRSDVLAAGGSYPALTLTVSVANDAPAAITNTATVAGGGEVNTANDTASDPTTISQVADLSIAISHGGAFTAGGTGTYTITVSNVGQATSNGPVMISDVLPTGLTYTGQATGDGWSVSAAGQTITATRSDVLASGASFPALTLTVSVANDAPTTVTNTVTVSGGGELNTGNDSASDVAAGLGRRRRGSDAPTAYTGGVMATVLDGVANTFTHSQEYFATLVMQDYQQLLHRTPATAEVSIWVNILHSGVSDEQVLAGFTSSPEYFQQSGSTDRAWIDALYHDLLDRSPDAAGESAWLHALAAGNSRSSIALGFAASMEHESDVISAAYQRYLGRTPGAAEVAGWVGNLQHGMADEQVVAAFVASAEFYASHGSTLQNWINGMYQLVFQRAPDPNGLNYWNQLLQGDLGTG